MNVNVVSLDGKKCYREGSAVRSRPPLPLTLTHRPKANSTADVRVTSRTPWVAGFAVHHGWSWTRPLTLYVQAGILPSSLGNADELQSQSRGNLLRCH